MFPLYFNVSVSIDKFNRTFVLWHCDILFKCAVRVLELKKNSIERKRGWKRSVTTLLILLSVSNAFIFVTHFYRVKISLLIMSASLRIHLITELTYILGMGI